MGHKSWWVWINRNSLDFFYVKDNNVTYFYSFVVEHIPKEIRKFIGNQNTITDI